MTPTATTELPTHKDLPDKDGEIVENYQELPQNILLSGCLTPHLRRLRPDGRFSIGSDNGIYWKVTKPPLRGCKSPDFFVVLDVEPQVRLHVRLEAALRIRGAATNGERVALEVASQLDLHCARVTVGHGASRTLEPLNEARSCGSARGNRWSTCITLIAPISTPISARGTNSTRVHATRSTTTISGAAASGARISSKRPGIAYPGSVPVLATCTR